MSRSTRSALLPMVVPEGRKHLDDLLVKLRQADDVSRTEFGAHEKQHIQSFFEEAYMIVKEQWPVATETDAITNRLRHLSQNCWPILRWSHAENWVQSMGIQYSDHLNSLGVLKQITFSLQKHQQLWNIFVAQIPSSGITKLARRQ
jgi:hypothetical protein